MTVLIILVGLVVYLLPWIVAAQRGQVSGGGVFLVNVFFGWTLIGWLVAFVWACAGKTHRDVQAEQRRHAELLGALRPPTVKP